MRFLGQTAIVTGASRGIGLAVAGSLVNEGARVVITGRDKALGVATELLGGDACVIGVPGSADDQAHQADAVRTAIEVFGSLDLLVNNTGINPTCGPIVEMSHGAARKIFEVNCLAALSWVQLAYREWMAEHGGAVVNISSVAGVKPAPGIGFYGSSKAMLTHMTQELALELAPSIRVNAVAPAVVKTKLASALFEGKEQEVAAAYPLQRLGVPEDISSVVMFLLSEESSWITGQLIVVDGGLTLTGGV
jgi:3-oxoacyl-[acyl-carrier protein] reductase